MPRYYARAIHRVPDCFLNRSFIHVQLYHGDDIPGAQVTKTSAMPRRRAGTTVRRACVAWALARGTVASRRPLRLARGNTKRSDWDKQCLVPTYRLAPAAVDSSSRSIITVTISLAAPSATNGTGVVARVLRLSYLKVISKP